MARFRSQLDERHREGIGGLQTRFGTQSQRSRFLRPSWFCLWKKHDYIKAAADFGQAILLNPGSPEACNNLAWLRATCPEASLRDGKEAVELATRACDQTGYKIQSLVDTLAAAYAETDDFENAVKYEKLSLGLISATPQNRPAMEERLALYEHRKPFRQKPNP